MGTHDAASTPGLDLGIGATDTCPTCCGLPVYACSICGRDQTPGVNTPGLGRRVEPPVEFSRGRDALHEFVGRDARANLPTGPQKVVQMPGTRPAPERDALHDLHHLAETAVESQAKSDAHNEAMRASMEAQQAAILESVNLARRAAVAAERQAEALETIAQVFGATCQTIVETMADLKRVYLDNLQTLHSGAPPSPASTGAPPTDLPDPPA